MKMNPCYNCKLRKAGCHNNCPKDKNPDEMGYQDWKKLNEAKKEAKRKSFEVESYVNERKKK